ncbi:hypothetical protein N0V90_010460 [Kalmusia sp. IMI 367209]|nr:hypothetical protein N0V90_010460 [Kalmusia sp. IMI 367209]
MSFISPFTASTAKAGHGSIELSVLPPDTPILRNVSYQYPLKLVAPDPLPPPDRDNDADAPSLVHTIFLLTYGGGIVAGDAINLSVSLKGKTRLLLLTQGSTKIFKTPDPKLVSRQHMVVNLSAGAALVYLPDPVQPFAQTAFSQSQIYYLEDEQGSICACDWVTSGRSARGENWNIHEYKSRNEVWDRMQLSERMDGYSVFGTLIIRGSVFSALAQHFLEEFEALPRIGGRDWGDAAQPELSPKEQRRAQRQIREKVDGLVWSAANVRGFVLVKFASREVEGSRNFLRDMIREAGSIATAFGERALLCLK